MTEIHPIARWIPLFCSLSVALFLCVLASKHVRNVEKFNQAGTKCEGKEIGDRNPDTEILRPKSLVSNWNRLHIFDLQFALNWCLKINCAFMLSLKWRPKKFVGLYLILETDFFRCLKSRFGVMAGWSLISVSNWVQQVRSPNSVSNGNCALTGVSKSETERNSVFTGDRYCVRYLNLRPTCSSRSLSEPKVTVGVQILRPKFFLVSSWDRKFISVSELISLWYQYHRSLNLVSKFN